MVVGVGIGIGVGDSRLPHMENSSVILFLLCKLPSLSVTNKKKGGGF